MTPFEFGAQAYKSGIYVPAHDANFLKSIGSRKIGDKRNIQELKEWIKGNDSENEKELREKFPELYQ